MRGGEEREIWSIIKYSSFFLVPDPQSPSPPNFFLLGVSSLVPFKTFTCFLSLALAFWVLWPPSDCEWPEMPAQSPVWFLLPLKLPFLSPCFPTGNHWELRLGSVLWKKYATLLRLGYLPTKKKNMSRNHSGTFIVIARNDQSATILIMPHFHMTLHFCE